MSIGALLSGCSAQKEEGYTVQAVDYMGKTVQMSEVSSAVENGKILIRMQDIIENNIVYTEYANGNTVIPLMTYVAESGRVVAAVSICEPCRSTRFFIEGNELVCSACYTRWELDGMKPVSGACMDYPPDEQEYEVQEGLLTLDESVIASWSPRL